MSSLLTQLLVVKEYIRSVYAKYNLYIDKLGSFLLSLLTFGLISANLTYMKALNNPLITIGLAMLCAFLPVHVTVFMAAVIMLLHLFMVSVEIAAIAFCIILVIFILYIRFVPKEAVVILLTPIAFALKVPYLMPLAMGLLGGPLSAISVGGGVLIYFIIHNIKEYAPVLSSTEESAAANLNFFADKIFQDKNVIMTLLTFVLIVVIVYAVKRLSADHSWAIAVGVGSLLNILLMLIGDFVFDINNSYIGLFAGTIISAAIAFVLQIFVFSVDYTRTERVQFEDDEYYYYVKAVPKISMTMKDKQVKKINPRRYMHFGRKNGQRRGDDYDLDFSPDQDDNL